jgi:DNA-binding NarL/FixJ family response regulator
VRVIVVSDVHPAKDALANVMRHVQGAVVVAVVDSLYDARIIWQQENIDVVVADISAVKSLATYGEQSLYELISTGICRLPDTHPAAILSGYQGVPCLLANKGTEAFTHRELDVFLLLGLGHSNREIARLLNITERTVKAHVGRILIKLNLQSRLQLGLAAAAYLVGNGNGGG